MERHLKMRSIGYATAEDLNNEILVTIEGCGLSIFELLTVSCDGSKVSKKLFRCSIMKNGR